MSGTDDLLPDQTDGFKVGEKKTIDEYHQMGTFMFLHLKSLAVLHLNAIGLQH